MRWRSKLVRLLKHNRFATARFCGRCMAASEALEALCLERGTDAAARYERAWYT